MPTILVDLYFEDPIFKVYLLCNYLGIRVQSLKKGQIIMDIDFRWGGDPSIILGVEAALVATIPIQVGVVYQPECFFIVPLVQDSCVFKLIYRSEMCNFDNAFSPFLLFDS